MSANRELTMDDYLAMLRRRLKVILIPALLAPIAGFGVSYLFSPKYTSTATLLVEGQKVPDDYVKSVIPADFTQRVNTLEQQVVSDTKLRTLIQNNGFAKPDEENKLIDEIRNNTQFESGITLMGPAGAGISGAKKKPGSGASAASGVNIVYSDSNAERAQKICGALASSLVDENLRERAAAAGGTTDFLTRQLDDAKRALDEQDAKLADFKRQYMGQLPTDADNNMRMLMSMNSQLDATTQTLARAQQDKAYTESILAQQIASWKASQATTNPQTLDQELTQLQKQLMELQARYTDDYPDVIKTKADIAEVEKKQKEMNAASAAASASDNGDKAKTADSPEIHQLRLQIHQYESAITQATVDQKRLQSSISLYQSRTAMSPNIEEKYNELARDEANAKTLYQDLLTKKSSAALGTSMENQQQGEQMHVVNPASLPADPSFPNRPIFAAGGLGFGLGLGMIIAIWLEFSDKSIRTAKDAAAIMDLPLLISVPWLGEEAEDAAGNGNGNVRRSFWGRGEPSPKEHENVGV